MFRSIFLTSTVLASILAACATPTDDAGTVDTGTGGDMSLTGGSAGAPPATGGVPSSGGAAGVMAVGGTAGDPGVGGAQTVGGGAGVPGAGGATAGTGADAGAPPVAGAPATGGVGGTPSTGGAPTAGTGGDGTAGTPSAGTGGTPGTGGSAGAPATGCGDGCAELSVPFTAWQSSQYFEIYLSADTDMSAAVITVRARKVSGKAGGLLIVVKDGSAQNYAYAQSAWNGVNEMTTDFTTYTLDVANPSSTDANNPFTPTAVRIISLQIAAGDPWYTDTEMTMEDPTALVNPTVVQIDDITITGTGTLPGPYTFTTDVMPLAANLSTDALNAMPPYAVASSTVTWVGP